MENLFDQKSTKSYLNILYNDEILEDSFFEKFIDSETYDTLKIVTFVSSPKFFFDNIKKFNKIILILGIEDNENLEKFIFDPDYQNNFYKNMDKETLNKIKDGSIEIRYATLGNPIHSKIYLFETKKQVSAFIGSANFSQTAFSNKKQYEELVGYELNYNEKFIKNFQNRFDMIYENSIDFIPQRIKKKINSEELTIIQLNEADSIDVLKENIEKISSVISLNKDIADELQLIKQKINKDEDNTQKELQHIQKTKKVLDIITKQRKGITILVTPTEIDKKSDIIIKKVFKKEIVKKEFIDSRNLLLFNPQQNSLFTKDSVNNFASILSKNGSSELIKSKIDLIEKFIQAYSNFTVNNDIHTQKRIFEAILYSFMSSYIWKVRDEYCKIDNRDEIKTSIPIFLVIAGQAQSGKTHLLRFISTITGNNGAHFHYKAAAKLHSMEDINPQVIDNFINEDNLTPIFVDEINKDYFSSNNASKSNYMGESYIKNITNSKQGTHPCVISTSNTDFSANAQVMRRIYYIQLNNPFKTATNEMREYFNSINESFGVELYQDFILRLENKFKYGISLNLDDCLYLGREIFLDYFNELQIKTPNWFPEKPINDYYTRGSEIWNRKYFQNKKYFQSVKGKNEFILNEEKIFGSRMSASRDKKELLQFLPVAVVKEEKGVTILNKEEFLKFIDANQSLWDMIKIF